MAALPQDIYCSHDSLRQQEQLFASAQNAETWLLLEYNSPWGAKAFEESSLAPEVKEHLTQALKATPKSNILFIRQPKRPREGLRFFVVRTREDAPITYAFTLNTHEDLLNLDLNAIIAEDAVYAAHQTDAPLYLVCTNTKRDRCCAKFGLPLYQALSAEDAENTWQCSHIGGHRFAPTAIFFPNGLCYGRLQPHEAAKILERTHAGKLSPEHLRGRVFYTPLQQAADSLLRQVTGNTDINAYHLSHQQEIDADTWAFGFTDHATGQQHTVDIQAIHTGDKVLASCNSPKMSEVIQYVLLQYEAEEAV